MGNPDPIHLKPCGLKISSTWHGMATRHERLATPDSLLLDALPSPTSPPHAAADATSTHHRHCCRATSTWLHMPPHARSKSGDAVLEAVDEVGDSGHRHLRVRVARCHRAPPPSPTLSAPPWIYAARCNVVGCRHPNGWACRSQPSGTHTVRGRRPRPCLLELPSPMMLLLLSPLYVLF